MFCTWVEKRIELSQNADSFEKDNNFIDSLVNYHKLHGYVRHDTYVEYESDHMHFSYDHATKEFKFEWKEGRWDYQRSKVTYIPAERNMVAAIPNWFEVKLEDDNIRDFMSDWEVARKATKQNLEVLGLGVEYRYDSSSNSDKVVVNDGVELDFTNTSSGLQSLIPLFVHLNYLDKLQYTQHIHRSIVKVNEEFELKRKIYEELFVNKGKTPMSTSDSANRPIYDESDEKFSIQLPFSKGEYAEEYKRIRRRYIYNNSCNIFLEEPEENLFPPTQARLANWLMNIANGEHPSNLFIATHSPYIVTSFIEKKNDDLGLFFTYLIEDGGTSVKSASDDEIQEIYDNGVDVFFNLESFV